MNDPAEVDLGDRDSASERPRRSLKRRIVIGLSCAAGVFAVLAATLVPMAKEARRAAVRLTDQ